MERVHGVVVAGVRRREELLVFGRNEVRRWYIVTHHPQKLLSDGVSGNGAPAVGIFHVETRLRMG